MQYINISSGKIFKGKIKTSSGSYDDQHKAEKLLTNDGFWRTRRVDNIVNESAVIDYGEDVIANYIELKPSQNGSASFPGGIKFEISNDLEEWRVIHSEKNIGSATLPFRLDIPLAGFRYLKIVIFEISGTGDKKYAEIGSCAAGISGIKSVKSDNAFTGNHSPENLFDSTGSSFWETAHSPSAAREGFTADLGDVYHLNKICITSADSNFPEWFFVEVSEDNNIWIPVIEEKNFSAEPQKKYFWNMETVAARYVKFQAESASGPQNKFYLRIGSIEIFSAGFDYSHIHNIGTMTPPASIFKAGIIKLGKDGERERGTVVQANDSRLREASTLFKGIVRLAEDGDGSEGSVVQSSDSRLMPASEFKPGIVRFAYDRENNPGAAVQSSDSRLQQADDNRYGIVKLCPEGVYAENTAVTGNDPRIRKATIDTFGIVKIAPDGESAEGAVVQSTDRRLNEAGVGTRGIMCFAGNGEVIPEAAVQADDRRLKDATVHAKGIVELAEDGECTPGTVIQAHDRRLKDATVDTKGIVELAEDGEEKKGAAVQGNDRRLKNASVAAKGIMRFAADGEDSAEAAVQGNDRRLKNAAAGSKGIVELAEDGGINPDTAVQGNDHR